MSRANSAAEAIAGNVWPGASQGQGANFRRIHGPCAASYEAVKLSLTTGFQAILAKGKSTRPAVA